MKHLQLKTTSIVIIIGAILISINNIINLKNYNFQSQEFLIFIATWIGTIIIFSVCSIFSVSYIVSNKILKEF